MRYLTVILTLLLFIGGCKHDVIFPGDKTDSNCIELTLIHFNDGESHILNAGAGKESFGGVARLATVIQNIRKSVDADVVGTSVMTLSTGNNFLPGVVFDLSLKKGLPYYDAIALDIIGIDAISLGSHDFDLGPNVLANFIGSFHYSKPVFLAANLNFSDEAKLKSLKSAGYIAKSTIVERGKNRFGIIGVVTPRLKAISSPGNIRVDKNLVSVVQNQAKLLEQYGINKIILLSNLGDLRDNIELVKSTSHIDIVVAGGDVLLANEGDLLLPSDSNINKVDGPYPLYIKNKKDKITPIVTTTGNYCYVGLLKVVFDSLGELVSVSKESKPIRVVGEGYPDSVAPNAEISRSVIIPIAKKLSTMSDLVGLSQVFLDGEREHIRSHSTNLGNLVADALLLAAQKKSSKYNANFPTIALLNGGAIKGSIKKGKIFETDIYGISNFKSIITIVERLSPKQLKALLESSLSKLRTDRSAKSIEDASSFPQLSNFSIIYNPTRLPGKRVKELKLDSGDVIVQNYRLVKYAPSVDIATIDCLSRGGDGWDFSDCKKINIGVSLPNAIKSFITTSVSKGGLNKIVLKKRYLKNGKNRILVTRE